MKRTISFALLAMSVFVGTIVLFAMGENVGRSNEREFRARQEVPPTPATAGPGQPTYYAPSHPPVAIESAALAGPNAQGDCDEFQFPCIRRIWVGGKAFTSENDESEQSGDAPQSEASEQNLYIEQSASQTVLEVLRFPGERTGIGRRINSAAFMFPISKVNFYAKPKSENRLVKLSVPTHATQAIVVVGPLSETPRWIGLISDSAIVVEVPAMVPRKQASNDSTPLGYSVAPTSGQPCPKVNAPTKLPHAAA